MTEPTHIAWLETARGVLRFWWVVLIAIGMSVLYRRPARRLALAFMGTYVVLAGVLTIAMVLTGGTT